MIVIRKKGWIRAGEAFLALVLLMGLSACTMQKSEIKSEKSYVIGVVTKSRDSEYWMSVCSGIEKAAADLNVSSLILSPDTEADEKIQEKMIYDLIDKGVDALAISPINSYHCEEYVKVAREKGIAVFSYDTDMNVEGVPYIGIDNEKAGRDLAEYMAKQLSNEGMIGIISGSLQQKSHSDRTKGFLDYIKNNTRIQVAFNESGYSNLQVSEQEISRLMKENPQISGIYTTSAVTALGIMEYLENQPVKIITFDAQEDALEAVKNGGIAALAAQSGYDIGYETIHYIMNQEKGISQEEKQILPASLITKENVNQYKTQTQ